MGGITVNNLQSGPMTTDMNPENSEFAESRMGLMEVACYGRAEELAAFVTYIGRAISGLCHRCRSDHRRWLCRLRQLLKSALCIMPAGRFSM